jgi:predicted aspartyl protease
MTRTFAVLALMISSACGGPTSATVPATPASADQVTVPLHVEGNRPFVDLTFHKPDGTTRIARFVVDSGGGGFLIVEPLARELGLALGETMREEDGTFAKVMSAIHVSIDRVALELDPERVVAAIGRTSMLPPVAPGHADGLLPGHVLAHYHVVFDYPKRTFTIARPRALTPAGASLSMPVATRSGFPRTEIEVGGSVYAVLLDTGASFTMMSQAVLEAWASAHPDWKREKGAVGDAATLGGQTLETMFLPALTWNGNALAGVGVVSQRTGVFEGWMSPMMTAPVVGSLAGNVLTQFRVDLDYPEQKLYLSRP